MENGVLSFYLFCKPALLLMEILVKLLSPLVSKIIWIMQKILFIIVRKCVATF